MNGMVQTANPTDVPMRNTGYYLWLETKKPRDIHSISTKLEYLDDVFGFKLGMDFISEDTQSTLKAIECFYFHHEIRPILKEYELKLHLYDLGKYSFPVPPVSHAQWSRKNWIDYIDAHGKWGTV